MCKTVDSLTAARTEIEDWTYRISGCQGFVLPTRILEHFGDATEIISYGIIEQYVPSDKGS